MNLPRRIARLEVAAIALQPPEPVFSEEDLRIMRGIVERTYADPVRYAKRIELFESLGMTRQAAMEFVAEGRPMGAGAGRE